MAGTSLASTEGGQDGTLEGSSQDSDIRLVDRSTGLDYPTAAAPAVVYASGRGRWRSPLVFEIHRMPPHAYDEHVVVGHQLMLNLGSPVRLGWREGDRRHEEVLGTGALCIQSAGDANAPLWRDEMTFATASIPHSMVEALLRDRAPSPTATFAKRHCVSDRSSQAYVRALAGELASPTEPLYSEALSLAFVLHLLSSHGQSTRRKQLAPRGGLGPAQLRAAVELAHEGLASDLCVSAMASAAGYSPFHFSRLFKATTGMAPHQFVLRLRLERAARLLRGRRMALKDVAAATGFFDQPHFTRVFRKAFGVTPSVFAAER